MSSSHDKQTRRRILTHSSLDQDKILKADNSVSHIQMFSAQNESPYSSHNFTIYAKLITNNCANMAMPSTGKSIILFPKGKKKSIF